MWKILSLALFGTLLNVSEGKKVGIISSFSFQAYESIVGDQLKLDGLLQSHLKKIAFEDISLPGILGLQKITGINIADVEITLHKVTYIPGFRGAEIVNGIQLTLGGSLLAGLPSVIKITLAFQFTIKYEFVDFQEGHINLYFRECNTLFGDISIQVLSVNLTPTALNTIKNSIFSSISLQICKILIVAFDVVKDRLLETLNVVIPFEPFGSIRCQMASLPDTTNGLIFVYLFVDFDTKDQGLLSIPDSAPDIILPPLDKYRHCQCVHVAILNIFLSLVLRIQPQEFRCTPDVTACQNLICNPGAHRLATMFSGADQLRATILALIPNPPPSIASAILHVQVRLLGSPVLHLGDGSAIVAATAQMEFFFKNTDGTTTSVAIMQGSISLIATFTVTEGYLHVSLSIHGYKVLLVSSALGITDISSLEPHCGSLLSETFLGSLNVLLKVGIRLPSILTAVLDKVLVQFIEHGLLLCI